MLHHLLLLISAAPHLMTYHLSESECNWLTLDAGHITSWKRMLTFYYKNPPLPPWLSRSSLWILVTTGDLC